MKYLLGFFIVIVIFGFYIVQNNISHKKLDIKNIQTLCNNIDFFYKKDDLNSIVNLLHSRLQISKSNIRISEEGVFIKTKEFFVEEEGLFFSFTTPQNNINGDPSFYHINGCVSSYIIKG